MDIETLALCKKELNKQASKQSATLKLIIDLIKGHEYTTQLGTSPTYSQNVPTGAQGFAAINKIGGRSVVFNQLVRNGNFEGTTSWILDGGGTGSISSSDNILSATIITPEASMHLSQWAKFVSGHRYLFHTKCFSDATTHIRFLYGDIFSGTPNIPITSGTWNDIDKIMTCTSSYNYFLLYMNTSTELASGNTVKFSNINVFDLTQMFGAGNEPATVEEFKAMFPDDYYPYNTGEIISAKTNKITSKSNNTEIASYSIPQSLLAFLADKGYGWSAGDVYNYIDFGNKKYIKNVGQIDLGTLTWSKPNLIGRTLFYASMPITAQFKIAGNLTCKYPQSKATDITGQPNTTIWNQSDTFIARNIVIRNDNLSATTKEEFKQLMNGVMLNYEMENHIEYDISEYISDDNFISVKENGTLTFEQENNTQLPIYNEIAYLVRVADALGE